MERETMPYDVVIVGAGPAGLAAACRLKQLNAQLSVCVVEKGSEVGAHILSGAVVEPKALNELFPDWQSRGAPLDTAVTKDRICWLTSATGAQTLPAFVTPSTMHNKGNYIISLGRLCRWLAEQAEALGVDVFPGFSAAQLAYDADGAVVGVITGDMGVDAKGAEKPSFAPGMALQAKFTLLAEGCRGHLGKQVLAKFGLAEDKDPQHYALGIKEIWKVPSELHEPGLVVHTAGWPLLQNAASGGGFIYHLENRQVAVGLITDLNYSNPYLNPYQEFQRFKLHPEVLRYLKGGERTAYGARAIVKGGLQALPRFAFPGGVLIGDDAGTLNFAKIKGTHTAMKSGMLAAEEIVKSLNETPDAKTLLGLDDAFRNSWVHKELKLQRNFGPAVHRWGSFWGGVYAFFDINLARGCVPWTLRDTTPDHKSLSKANASTEPLYPKPDGVITFDLLSSVYLSNTNHEEDQPCHLRLTDAEIPIKENLPLYDEPAQRYCPAGVYEVISTDGGEPRFQINAQNCVHCKTCDIKDPAQNITWVPPEGGGGPNYGNM